jgi:hypothetical protein
MQEARTRQPGVSYVHLLRHNRSFRLLWLRFLRRAIAPSFILTALGYAFYGAVPALWLAAIAVVIAHMGGATEWVYSSALMQVPDRLLGRVFAIEYVAFTLMTSLSSWPAQRSGRFGEMTTRRRARVRK